jgi:nucleotide-binding universal stress UspA family protein
MILPKIEIKKILFATDLSENARLALAYAVSMANLRGIGLTIVHAVEDTPGMDAVISYHVGAERWAEIKQQRATEARKAIIGKQRYEGGHIQQALQSIYRKASTEFEEQTFQLDDVLVKNGNPVDVIIEAAEKTGCDIIVMGTQGHGGLARMMMGSTARRVLKQSRIPVLVVPLPD